MWTGEENEDKQFQMFAADAEIGIPVEVSPLRLYDPLMLKMLNYDHEHKDERIAKYSRMVDVYKE